ncbi:MAG: 2Fe-2S iron-sulfur cluster-binding protein [Myxococcota bacterium]|nr:2Fe-2S iron-sulfur cluster-binding protein [Myxococcota bacterium]
MTFLIRFEPSRKSIEVPVGTTLLEAVQRAELPIASACGADATCARCGLEILEGADTLAPEAEHERDIKQRNRIDTGLRLSCCIDVAGDMTVTAPYW